MRRSSKTRESLQLGGFDEDFEEDALFEDDDDDSYFTTLVISIVIGLGLELFCCVLASVACDGTTFGVRTVVVMWATFGCLFILRCVLIWIGWQQLHTEGSRTDKSMRLMQVLCTLCFWPFLFYLPCLNFFLIDMCTYVSASKSLQDKFAISSWASMNTTQPEVVFQYYRIHCGEGALENMIPSIVPMIGQVGIPLLFAYMVIKLADRVWDIDLMRINNRHALMITLLDFVDSSTFPTMIYSPSTFVFVNTHRIWLIIVTGLFIVGYLMALIRIMVLARIGRGLCQFKDKHRLRCLAASTFSFLDLPFMVVRCYFLSIGLGIAYIMLAKNFLAALYVLPIVITGTIDNPVSQAVAKLVSLMPGADKVTNEGRHLLFHLQHDNLEELEKQVREHKSMFEAITVIKQMMEHELTTPFSQVDESKVRRAFQYFDANQDNTISKEELQDIFKYIPVTPKVDLEEHFRENAGDDGKIDLVEFIKTFVEAYNEDNDSETS